MTDFQLEMVLHQSRRWDFKGPILVEHALVTFDESGRVTTIDNIAGVTDSTVPYNRLALAHKEKYCPEAPLLPG